MTTQIAVRLPETMVAWLDAEVAAGNASSRAALVALAVEREMRQRVALADADILRASGDDDDLDDLATWAASSTRIED